MNDRHCLIGRVDEAPENVIFWRDVSLVNGLGLKKPLECMPIGPTFGLHENDGSGESLPCLQQRQQLKEFIQSSESAGKDGVRI